MRELANWQMEFQKETLVFVTPKIKKAGVKRCQIIYKPANGSRANYCKMYLVKSLIKKFY